MNKETIDGLWEQVVHIGKVERLCDDAMVALGSVFGKMSHAIKNQQRGEIYIILSVTGPEIVDFTFYTELNEVLARVDDLNKLAGKREYWYITMYSNHRNVNHSIENAGGNSGNLGEA